MGNDKTISTSHIPLQPDYVRDWILAVTKPANFLLIDDDPHDRELFARFSRGWNCKFDLASNMEEAKKFIALKSYRLVFLDIKFPGYSGVDVFKELKAINPKVKVAFLSGYISNETVQQTQSLGLTIFIAKPQAFTDEFFSSLYNMLNVTKLPANDKTT
jgi:DNA-binding NtrC family response regulator